MSKRIVYLATHSWSSDVRVGSHHIAAHFALDHQVLYVSHPITLGSLFSASDNQLVQRMKLFLGMDHTTSFPDGIQELVSLVPFAPGTNAIQGLDFVIEHGWKFAVWPRKRAIKKLGFQRPDELWIDSFFQLFWIDLLEPKRIFFRVADDPRYIANMSRSLEARFRSALAVSSLVITPASATADYLRQITTSPVEVVPNGADIAHFSSAVAEPCEYRAVTQYKIVFVGAIARWIDVDLIREVAQQMTDSSLYLIGPNHGENLGEMPENVHLLGPRAYADVPGYLQHADLAIAPFDVESHRELVEGVDAIKLYEYLASGVPIVATRWTQSEQLIPYVHAVDRSEFVGTVKACLQKGDRPPAPSEFLTQRDWSARLARLDDLVAAVEEN